MTVLVHDKTRAAHVTRVGHAPEACCILSSLGSIILDHICELLCTTNEQNSVRRLHAQCHTHARQLIKGLDWDWRTRTGLESAWADIVYSLTKASWFDKKDVADNK